MKKYTYLFLTLCCIGLFASCSKEDDAVIDEAWKLANEQAFQAIASNTLYSSIQSEANDGVIYYKELIKGTGKPVYYNSRVRVYYQGTNINGEVFDQRLFEDGTPLNVAVNSLVADYSQTNNPTGYQFRILGWTTALQKMVVGDKWELWIPQQLGYGTVGSGSAILGYSTLKFEIEVIEVVE